MKATRLHTLHVSDRAQWRLKDDRTVFVKMNSSDDPKTRGMRRRLLRSEKKCLRLVSGLAAPELVSLDPRLFTRAADAPPAPSFLAETTIEGERINELDLRPWQLVGIWAFLVEQLVAFRCHGLLYSDLKCDNILVQERPLKVMIVDFDSVNSYVPGKGVIYKFRYTAGHEAPEITQGRIATETSLVFSVAAFLVRLLTRRNSYQLRGPEAGLAMTVRLLTKMGSPGLAKVVARSLAADQKERYSDYPAILREIKAASLSPRAQKTWDELRAPYAARLSGLGL